MGQFNNKVKVEVLKDFLAKGNGVVQVQDLFVALGSKPKRVRCAVHWTRRTGTPLFAIRERVDGKRGAGRIVAYSTSPQDASATVAPKPVVAAKKAAPKKVKSATQKPAPVVKEAAPVTPAPGRVMSMDEVRAKLAKTRKTVTTQPSAE